MEEEQTHLDAFEIYFKARQEGQTKTHAIRRVADEYHRAESTIFGWHKDFGWEERESIRAAQIREEVQTKTDSTITDNKIKYMGIVHSPLNKYVEECK